MELSDDQRFVYEEAEALGLTVTSPVLKNLHTFSDDATKVRVHTSDGPVFLKWGNTPEGKERVVSEVANIKLLDEAGVSPELIAHSEERASYATEWIGGSDGAELPEDQRLDILWRTIGKIRAIDPDKMPTQQWQSLFLFKTDPADPIIPDEVPSSRKKALEKAYFKVRELDGRTSLHGDFHTGNLIYSGDRLLVIDPEHMLVGVPGWDLVYYLGYDDAGMSPVKRASWLRTHVVEKELRILMDYLIARGYTWASCPPEKDKYGNIVERGMKNLQLTLPLYEELFSSKS